MRQFHKNKAGNEETVILGRSNDAEQSAWLLAQRKMAKQPGRTSISYTFANGEECLSTGKPRRTEVILKCIEGENMLGFDTEPTKMYMLEPTPCEYVLTVETTFACVLIRRANDDSPRTDFRIFN